MKCEFERQENYVVCRWCGFKFQTEKSPNTINKECKNTERTLEYPSMFRSLVNVVGAGIKYIGSGFKNASEEEQKRRLDICHGCEFFDKSQNRCSKCSCYLSWKTVLESSECPIGKWKV